MRVSIAVVAKDDLGVGVGWVTLRCDEVADVLYILLTTLKGVLTAGIVDADEERSFACRRLLLLSPSTLVIATLIPLVSLLIVTLVPPTLLLIAVIVVPFLVPTVPSLLSAIVSHR